MNITLLDELPTLVHQGLERCKISGSYHIPIQLPIWLVQKTDESWIMTIDSYKFNQVVASSTAPIRDVVLLFEQINTSPRPSMQLVIWKLLFS